MGRPASSDYWRQWRAAHPVYRARERERGRARRQAGYRSPKTRRPRLAVEPTVIAPHPLITWAQELATDLLREDHRARLSDELYPDVVGESSWRGWSARTRSDAPQPGCEPSAPGATTSHRCSRSAERWMARSRVCACRGCERHTGACGWPTTNERRCDRCGRPGFANRFRRTPDHPVRRTSAWRRLAKRTVEAHVARHGWTCPGWHHPAHPVRSGDLAADHPEPLVLGGEPLPAHPGVLCSSCNARKGLSQRRRWRVRRSPCGRSTGPQRRPGSVRRG